MIRREREGGAERDGGMKRTRRKELVAGRGTHGPCCLIGFLFYCERC